MARGGRQIGGAVVVEAERVGLAEDEVARRAIGVWPASPRHDPVVAGVGDEERAVGDRDRMRPAHAARARARAGVLVAGIEVALP